MEKFKTALLGYSLHTKQFIHLQIIHFLRGEGVYTPTLTSVTMLGWSAEWWRICPLCMRPWVRVLYPLAITVPLFPALGCHWSIFCLQISLIRASTYWNCVIVTVVFLLACVHGPAVMWLRSTLHFFLQMNGVCVPMCIGVCVGHILMSVSSVINFHILKNFLFMCLCICAHGACDCRGWERTLAPWKLELLTCVLGM